MTTSGDITRRAFGALPVRFAPSTRMKMKATAKMMRKVIVDSAEAESLLCWICFTTRIDSVCVPWPPPPPPPVRMAGRSYMRSASSVRNRIATTSAGFSSGSVMRKKVWMVLEPSIFAAS